MKKLFPGHFEIEEDYSRIWDESIFGFDANILLNLYRYSDATRKEFYNILDKMKRKIWLPYRAAEEYLNNRLDVIYEQQKSYDDTIKNIKLLKKDLESPKQHPFVSENNMEKINESFQELCDELAKNKEVHTIRITEDEIKDQIVELFDSKVGQAYERDRLQEIFNEGLERYKDKIPPGFKDDHKANEEDTFTAKCHKYGDLVIWYQVIDKSIESKKSIIFVTDDKKEDWWQIFKGKTIGPRPELVKEFLDKTKNYFMMYKADNFLRYASKHFNEPVSDSVFDEISDLRKRGITSSARMRSYPSSRDQWKEKIEKDIMIRGNEIQELRKEINILDEEINRQGDSGRNMRSIKRSENISEELSKKINEYNKLNQKLRDLNKELDKYETRKYYVSNRKIIDSDNY